MRLQRTAVLQCCRFTVTRLSSVLTRSEGAAAASLATWLICLVPDTEIMMKIINYTKTNNAESL